VWKLLNGRQQVDSPPALDSSLAPDAPFQPDTVVVVKDVGVLHFPPICEFCQTPEGLIWKEVTCEYESWKPPKPRVVTRVPMRHMFVDEHKVHFPVPICRSCQRRVKKALTIAWAGGLPIAVSVGFLAYLLIGEVAAGLCGILSLLVFGALVFRRMPHGVQVGGHFNCGEGIPGDGVFHPNLRFLDVCVPTPAYAMKFRELNAGICLSQIEAGLLDAQIDRMGYAISG
jgi:hypothetical protein